MFTPNDIEVLIHCHVCPNPYPRASAPAVKSTIEKFKALDLIKPTDNYYTTTLKGHSLLLAMQKTPMPLLAWVDKENKILLLESK